MGIATKILGLFCFLLVTSSYAEAQKRPGRVRMYYDAQNNRYFTAKESYFKLRPRASSRKSSPIEVKINQGEFSPFKGKIEFDGEGLNIVEFRSPDPVLDWSPTQKFRFFVDQTPPKSEVLFEGASIEKGGYTFIHPDTQFRIVAQDRLSGVKETFWKFGKKTRKFPGKAQFKKPGKYRFQFASVDQVENREDWNVVQFVVDQKAPKSKPSVIGESSIKGKLLYLSTGSLLGIDSKDDASGVKKIEYQINQGPIETYKQPVAINAGKTELKYRATDEVGNVEKWKTFLVYADNRAPELDIKRTGRNIITRGRIYALPGFKIAPTAKDSESGIEKIQYKLGESEWIQFKSKPILFRKTGKSMVRFKAYDGVGNETISAPIEVIIDKTAPKTQFLTKNQATQSGDAYSLRIPNTIRFLSDDSGVGVERIEYSFDNKSFFKFSNPIDLAMWKNSRRTLYYRSVDRLGNKEPTQEINISIKSENPQADLYVETKSYPSIPLSSLMGRSAASSEKKSTKSKRKRIKKKRSKK